MNEPLICSVAFVFIVLWREFHFVVERHFTCCRRFRGKVPRCRCCTTAWLFQWYTLVVLLLTYMLGRTVVNIYYHEVLELNWLSFDKVNSSLSQLLENATAAHELTEEEMSHELDVLAMSPQLRKLSIAGTIAGLSASLVAMLTFLRSVLRGRNLRRHLRTEGYNTWRLDRKHDYALFVIIMPAVFALLAILAQVRVWRLMTGSSGSLRMPCHLHPLKDMFKSLEDFSRVLSECFNNRIGQWVEVACGHTYWEMKRLEFWTADVNLEIAEVVQYVPIWAFCMMVIEYFEYFNAVSDEDLKENFYIDQAEYVDEAGVIGLTRLDVTERVLQAIKENGARDFTRGKPLKKMFPDIHSSCTNYLQVKRGRYVRKYFDRRLPFFCLFRRRFNLARLDRSFDYYLTMKRAGLLGVWVYIALGCVRVVVSACYGYWLDLAKIPTGSLRGFEASWSGRFSNLTLFSMFVCVINMHYLLGNQDLKHPDALGQFARFKFLSTAGLLMISQLQPILIEAFMSQRGPSRMQQWAAHCNNHLDHVPTWLLPHVKQVLSVMDIPICPTQERLIHASLICIWCLFFALINFMTWAHYPNSPLAPTMSFRSDASISVEETPGSSRSNATVKDVVELIHKARPEDLEKVYAMLQKRDASPRFPQRCRDKGAQCNFKLHTFWTPTYCDECGNFLLGLVNQGALCTACNAAVCPTCARPWMAKRKSQKPLEAALAPLPPAQTITPNIWFPPVGTDRPSLTVSSGSLRGRDEGGAAAGAYQRALNRGITGGFQAAARTPEEPGSPLNQRSDFSRGPEKRGSGNRPPTRLAVPLLQTQKTSEAFGTS